MNLAGIPGNAGERPNQALVAVLIDLTRDEQPGLVCETGDPQLPGRPRPRRLGCGKLRSMTATFDPFARTGSVSGPAGSRLIFHDSTQSTPYRGPLRRPASRAASIPALAD